MSYAHLNELKKKIKTDHPLAVELWQSAVHDARVLATMIADPEQCRMRQLNSWLREVDNYILSGALGDLTARSPLGARCATAWIARKGEWAAAAGWNALAQLAMEDDALTEGELEKHLYTIQKHIHAAPNRTRHSMNNALIAIGLRSDKLQKKALAAAKAIGPVSVDHGQTNCKTPDATAYIKKAAQRKAKRK